MKTDIILKTVVLNAEGKMLLLRRSDTDDRRPLQWDLPGGLQDLGETLVQGAIREINEESGLNVENVELFFAKAEPMVWIKEGLKNYANSVRLYFFAHTSDTKIRLSYEHIEFSWVTFEQAKTMLDYPRHQEVISYIIDNKLEL